MLLVIKESWVRNNLKHSKSETLTKASLIPLLPQNNIMEASGMLLAEANKKEKEFAHEVLSFTSILSTEISVTKQM